MIILFLFSLASIWNQPIVGAVTKSTAVVLVGLTEQDSSVTEFGLTDAYGSKSDTIYGKWNKMNLSGLDSDTVYHYKTIVWRGADSTESSDRVFKTQNTTGTFTCVLIGDPQPYLKVYKTVTDSLWDQIRKEHADFVLTIGDQIDARGYFAAYGWDIVSTELADTLWHILHTHIDSMLDSMMVCFTFGNHETYSVWDSQPAIDSVIEAYNHACVSYPTGLDSAYYWFEWGNSAFVIANSHWVYRLATKNRFGSTQMEWLTDVLCDSMVNKPFRWRFMFFHLPFFGGHTSTHWESTERDSLLPMMDLADIDIVFNAHNHVYDYVGDFDNTTAIVSGGGGGTLSTSFPHDLSKHHYILLNVYPDSVRGYIKDEFGDTLTAFLVRKKIKKLGGGVFGGVKL